MDAEIQWCSHSANQWEDDDQWDWRLVTEMGSFSLLHPLMVVQPSRWLPQSCGFKAERTLCWIAVWTRDVCECLDLHLSHTELKSFHIHHLLFWILSLTSKLNFHFVFASLFCHHFVVQLLCCLNHCSEWHICPNNIVFGQHGSWWEFLGTVNLMFFTVKVGQI